MGTTVVGFDLDMTLLDTSAGIVATLHALGDEEGVRVDADDLLERLGTPWNEVMLRWFPPDRAEHVTRRFRELFLEHGLDSCAPMPGAPEALDVVRSSGARPLVVTGRYETTARACLARVGFDLGDAVVGSVFGAAKGAVLRAEGAIAYVGDTPSDIEGAHAADALAVTVATGPATEAELRLAGADVVLPHMAEFPPWFQGWWPRRR